jgi:pimeloyl-ACP methyl ester carboxylesterase
MFLRFVVPLLGAVLLGGCAKRLEPGLVPAQVLRPQTSDGWTLELRHHGGEGPPVLLMHGMGANHYNWDFHPTVSPVDELVEAGYDVWVGGLRGDPGSDAPSRRAHNHITFDDYAERDVPVLVDAVLEATGETSLLWVGHSMGGMLLYTTLNERPEVIRAGVAVASPADFSRRLGTHAFMRRLGWLVAARRGRVPVRPAVALGVARLGLIKRQLANPDNLDGPAMRGMARHTLIDLPRPVARQARSWLRTEAFTRLDGSPWLDDTASVDVPLLVIGAVDDRVANEPDVAQACRIFAACDYVLLSEATGFASDYGHIDPVVGTTAHAEVYPLIFAFLDAHRPVEVVPGAVEVAPVAAP